MLISDGVNHVKLQSIIVGELKKAGLKHRLKKIILKNVKDHKTVFGAPLGKVPLNSVICCGSTLSIPNVVSEMSSVLRSHANVEGLFRKAGSQSRQKEIKRMLDAGGCVTEGHHPIDVASVLKLYLRCLPEPLISAEVQDLLLRCRVTAGEDGLKAILHTLLLLPVLHVHLLHYIMELLNFIASRHKENLMDSTNLAIVLAPSIMPLPAAASAQRLEHHVALVKTFIENSQYIGVLTKDLITKLDDGSDVSQSRRKKRRSGSLNRMLSGLRKMVSGNVNTPATVPEKHKTPVLSKSAAKRKHENFEGLSVKNKKEITKSLQQNELSYTPMKMGVTERKRLRLSLLDARSTPVINTDMSSHKNSETSISSEDLLTSSENLFSAHDTIDLSPDMKPINKDYVRISKQEYEEIKSRVSAIENRLSLEFTDVIPRVQPLQQVQNVYEQTLEEVAMLNCQSSEHLARRLSRELQIRPKEQAKIIRSPSARKIGTIRRRSKENLTKIVRHKSWNASTQSHASQNGDRFYPYVGLSRRPRTQTAKPEFIVSKAQSPDNFVGIKTQDPNSDNFSNNSSQKYHTRKRISLSSDYNLDKTIGKHQPRRSLNVTTNISWNETESENSMNNTSSSIGEGSYSGRSQCYQHMHNQVLNQSIKNNLVSKHKWRNAAAFFMERTGEVENGCQSGRPSVNKLRQNAGSVLAKAKLFESSSDRSSELQEKATNTGFARKPRVNQYQNKYQKPQLCSKTKTYSTNQLETKLYSGTTNEFMVPKNHSQTSNRKEEYDQLRVNRKTTPSVRKIVSPTSNQSASKTPQGPALKKALCTPRSLRTPAPSNDLKKVNTPMRAVHISPRRRSPRYKQRVHNQ